MLEFLIVIALIMSITGIILYFGFGESEAKGLGVAVLICLPVIVAIYASSPDVVVTYFDEERVINTNRVDTATGFIITTETNLYCKVTAYVDYPWSFTRDDKHAAVIYDKCENITDDHRDVQSLIEWGHI